MLVPCNIPQRLLFYVVHIKFLANCVEMCLQSILPNDFLFYAMSWKWNTDSGCHGNGTLTLVVMEMEHWLLLSWKWNTDSGCHGDLCGRFHSDRWSCDCIILSDNTILCSGSRDNTLKLWDVETGRCLQENKTSRNLVWTCTNTIYHMT